MPESEQRQCRQSRSGWIEFLASKYLTLVVVALLIFLSLVGALVPQQGIVEENIIHEWQQTHSLATQVLSPAGFFSAFNSPLFLISLLVLFLNTLACTYKSICRDGLFAGKSTSVRLRRFGFLVLHLSILICIIGGFISAAFRMSGHLIVTEGQMVQDQHGAYPKIVEGPFRAEQHDKFQLELVDAIYTISEKWTPGRKAASVRLSDGSAASITTDIEFNYPVKFNKTSFTLREIGYAPEIKISSASGRIPPLEGFIALKVWGFNDERKHYDFIPLPQVGRRLSLTLYPSHDICNGEVVKTSEALVNPVLLVFQEVMNGTKTPTQVIAPGNSAMIGDLNIQFGELRQWAAFQVVHDPGYGIVCVSFWMAIIALGLRYTQDILDWIKEVKHHGKD
jgi:cytochrome c biogenesis protein ResB